MYNVPTKTNDKTGEDWGKKGGVREFGLTETLKHFLVLKIPEILIGRKVYNYCPLLL